MVREFPSKIALNPEAKAWLKPLLTGLSFVRWDRFIPFEIGMRVYGWINRDDSYKDFVVLDLIFGASPKAILIATSSAKYSKRIAEYLELQHNDCLRVETLGLDVPNIVKEKK